MAKQAGKQNSGVRFVKGVLATIGRIIATFIMVGIITGCIVACVLTVYVLNMIGADEEINLDQEQLGYSSIMLYYNPETETYDELQRLYIADNNRIWVDLDDISDYVKKAVVAIEDKRFYTHQGVDWRRTFGAFINQFIPGTSSGGGSTLTQQLIKNITGDDDYRIDRKVREIFRALELEKHYTKDRILEAYLNVVPFGAGTNGIEAASQTYFGKPAKDLDLAEAAAIVGITRYPGAYNPFLYPENNKERQQYILKEMQKQDKERLTQDIPDSVYEQAVKKTLVFKREEYQASKSVINTYFEDHVTTTVLKDLQEQKGWTKNYASEQLFKGGYRIYTTVDLEMQKSLEEKFENLEGFPAVTNKNYPQSCATITDINGKLLAVVGGTGEKTGNLMFNRATMATRQPGSALKPLAVYAPAFEYNRVNWSTIIDDQPFNISPKGQPEKMWPSNYYSGYKGPVTVAYAIQQSVNTVPAKLVNAMGPQTSFDFLKDSLNFYSLVDKLVTAAGENSDVAVAPMSLGALTNGVTPMEMAGGYQIFANGGTFTTPYCYTKVEDSNGRIILEADTTARNVISESTSVIMNKALQLVTTYGTGTGASLGSAMPTAGKTGTSEHDVNQWFVGVTPYYVCQVWLGYDEEMRINEYGNSVPNSIGYYSYPPPLLWKSIMEPLHEGLDYIPFQESEEVVSKAYCTQTGLLATDKCGSVASGWYRLSNLPSNCPGHVEVKEKGDDDSGSSSSKKSSKDKDSSKTEPVRVPWDE